MKAPGAADVKPAPDGVDGEFESLYREHHAMVFRAAYRVTGSPTDAEDVLQSVFLRMLQRGDDAPPVENAAAFLRRSAVNAALDLVRQRQNIRNIPLDELEPVLAESGHRRPDRLHNSSEIREWLREAVARLNPRIAAMFALRFFEGKDNPEIARLMNTTPGTVAVTLSRTRNRLQEEFRAQMGGAL